MNTNQMSAQTADAYEDYFLGQTDEEFAVILEAVLRVVPEHTMAIVQAVDSKQINTLLKALRDRRFQEGIVPSEPVNDPPSQIAYSQSRGSYVRVSPAPDGLEINTYLAGGDEWINGIFLDPTIETFVYQILKEREKARLRKLGDKY